MKDESIYDEKTILVFAAIGRVTVNFLIIFFVLTLIDMFTHRFSVYDENTGLYNEDLFTMIFISFPLSLVLTAAIYIIKSVRKL